MVLRPKGTSHNYYIIVSFCRFSHFDVRFSGNSWWFRSSKSKHRTCEHPQHVWSTFGINIRHCNPSKPIHSRSQSGDIPKSQKITPLSTKRWQRFGVAVSMNVEVHSGSAQLPQRFPRLSLRVSPLIGAGDPPEPSIGVECLMTLHRYNSWTGIMNPWQL